MTAHDSLGPGPSRESSLNLLRELSLMCETNRKAHEVIQAGGLLRIATALESGTAEMAAIALTAVIKLLSLGESDDALCQRVRQQPRIIELIQRHSRGSGMCDSFRHDGHPCVPGEVCKEAARALVMLGEEAMYTAQVQNTVHEGDTLSRSSVEQLELKNTELFVLQQQMLCASKVDRKALKQRVQSLDSQIAELQELHRQGALEAEREREDHPVQEAEQPDSKQLEGSFKSGQLDVVGSPVFVPNEPLKLKGHRDGITALGYLDGTVYSSSGRRFDSTVCVGSFCS